MNNDQVPTVSEIIDRLKLFYGYKFDTQVARRLGLSDGSAIGNWRRRNSIDILLIAEHCPEVNYDWLLWGRGTQTSSNAERRSMTAEDFAYLQKTGIPRERIITLVNEALEQYLLKERSEAQDAEENGEDHDSGEDDNITEVNNLE